MGKNDGTRRALNPGEDILEGQIPPRISSEISLGDFG